MTTSTFFEITAVRVGARRSNAARRNNTNSRDACSSAATRQSSSSNGRAPAVVVVVRGGWRCGRISTIRILRSNNGKTVLVAVLGVGLAIVEAVVVVVCTASIAVGAPVATTSVVGASAQTHALHIVCIVCRVVC